MAGHDSMAEYVLPWTFYAMARNSRWDEILAAPRPPDSTPSTAAMWTYVRGLALIAKNDAAGAKKASEEFAAARARVPKDLMLNTNRAEDLLTIAAAVLDARIARLSGDHAGAISQWESAIKVQDALIYDEPPAWYYPVRESLGAEYLLMKRYADAEKTFRRDLEINPNNPRSLFGLAQALKAQGKSDAADVQRRYEEAWKAAELQLDIGEL